jgi:L-ornithine N5-oxygenase
MFALPHREVGLLGIGAGPSNLALAVALEELAPADFAEDSLIIEQHENIVWQRGMLLPWARTQVSFLKDLVTLRNPRSKFTFTNYLHSTGRLDQFVNLGSFTPYRAEISDYLQWVAKSLERVRIEYGLRCVGIEPVRSAAGDITRWLVRLANESTIACRDLVVAVGREPRIPDVFATLPAERLVHSTAFGTRLAELDPEAAHSIVVVGGAQSAAEMLWTAHQSLPKAQCTMVMRSIGPQTYELSKFVNELYYPSFVDDFFAAPAEVRRQLFAELRGTNYSALDPELLETLYRQIYLERFTRSERLHVVTTTDVVDAQLAETDVVLTLVDRKTGLSDELRCDIVLLGTGFRPDMPPVVRQLAATIELDDIAVNRCYRMAMPVSAGASCYLQGVNEATHGIADSLLSVLAIRAEEIVRDLLGRRAAPEQFADSGSFR